MCVCACVQCVQCVQSVCVGVCVCVGGGVVILFRLIHIIDSTLCHCGHQDVLLRIL
jgi:hypothetical protein